MLAINQFERLTPQESLDVLRAHILTDGFKMLVDLQASHGFYLHDALSGREFLDFYAYFASQPIQYNHPKMRDPDFQARLLVAATTKVANPDVYTRFFAEYVKALAEVAALPPLNHYFFIDGGALAIENALKTAFDWKVRKNLAAGRGEIGSQVIHFKNAFHGRSGYTMSLTNTADPRKTMYFPRFDWPRIDCPALNFALAEPQRTLDVEQREAAALAQIHQTIKERGHDLACVIIETIQAEGGDNHFRPEFLQALRRICDEHEMLLIFDEVQCGMGITGKMWACEHFDVLPDILCFGKKMQICGIMAGPRIDDVDNVFKVQQRINSTWGGNLADMVRATQYLRIIDDEQLVENAGQMGTLLVDGLQRLASGHPSISAVRGRGLMCAFDLPTTELRDKLRQACYDRDMMVLSCGTRSLRFRPVLDIDAEHIERGMEILDEATGAVEAAG